MKTQRHLLVTSALPYANGSIHLGHMVEYIQTDIWVRFQRLRGNECYYMCADDTHGTPIMISARKQNISPQELIERMHREHTRDFAAFRISFDNYYSTNSEENRELAEYIYRQAQQLDAIYAKEIEQYYCEKDGMFLPDRMIKGTCPACKAKDQYGDACEICSATYDPTQLIEPFCAVCGAKPVLRKSTHYYFKLSAFTDKLKAWVAGGHVRPEIQNKLREWFDQGIKDWAISRDAPYFGFKIPGTEDKYFYVWMDAPVGYIASTKNWCKKNNRDFEDIWRGNGFEIHHFIGKDILYFHTLFWPAMLMAAGFSTPTRVHIHGFLTVNGEKMSKSRGTFIKAADYLAHLDPEFLRYYYASKLGAALDDLDLNLTDFVNSVNSYILGKVVNIGSRLGKIVNKKLDNKLTSIDPAGALVLQEIRTAIPKITDYYETLEFNKAMREIMTLADKVNKYINDAAPWETVKTDTAQAAKVCTAGLNALYLLTGLLKPVLPRISEGIEQFLNVPPIAWDAFDRKITDHTINEYTHLAERIDLAAAQKLVSTTAG
ncbi:MAG TPA: methionine--tRNA ligase [Candidatus Omnitrophota bacterium]|nr:methionine--tRNA ligase [Candidatus Omnitrophota bacterium]HRZ14345.1 methionine--tRNA ligase [Candidatus Omnitrophota bacterium]